MKLFQVFSRIVEFSKYITIVSLTQVNNVLMTMKFIERENTCYPNMLKMFVSVLSGCSMNEFVARQMLLGGRGSWQIQLYSTCPCVHMLLDCPLFLACSSGTFQLIRRVSAIIWSPIQSPEITWTTVSIAKAHLIHYEALWFLRRRRDIKRLNDPSIQKVRFKRFVWFSRISISEGKTQISQTTSPSLSPSYSQRPEKMNERTKN